MLTNILLETTFFRSKRVRRLAHAFGDDRMRVAGRFVHALCWAGIYHEYGDLTDCDDYDLAEAFGFDTPPIENFRQVLLDAGVLELTDDGRLILHDWMKHQGRFLRERDRQRNLRKRQKTGETARPEPQEQRTRTKRVRNADATRTERGANARATRTQRVSSSSSSSVPFLSEGSSPREIESGKEGGEWGGSDAPSRAHVLAEIARAEALGNPHLIETVTAVARRFYPHDAEIQEELEILLLEPARDGPSKTSETS